MPQRAFGPRRVQHEAREADLAMAGGRDFGAQCRRDQLRTEAETERRPVCREPCLKQANLVEKEGIFVRLIDPKPAAQHHDEIRRQQIKGRERAAINVEIGDIIARIAQQRRERAEVFETNMPDGDRGFHQRGSLSTLRRHLHLHRLRQHFRSRPGRGELEKSR